MYDDAVCLGELMGGIVTLNGLKRIAILFST